MSHTILKIGDLELDLLGQIGLQTSRIFILTVNHSTILNFTFQLELFIEHQNVSNFLKTGDLDLDLQGQICLET